MAERIRKGDYIAFTIEGKDVRARVTRTSVRNKPGCVRAEETTAFRRVETKDDQGRLTGVAYEETATAYIVPRSVITTHTPTPRAPELLK